MSGERARVDVTQGGVAQRVGQEQLENLPVAGRDFVPDGTIEAAEVRAGGLLPVATRLVSFEIYGGADLHGGPPGYGPA